MSTEKIWFVTGASSGLGLALVRMLLDQGPVSYTHLTLPTSDLV